MDKDVPENTQIKKRSVRISGHNTSITVEPEFWCALKTIAQQDGVSVNKLISETSKHNFRSAFSQKPIKLGLPTGLGSLEKANLIK